MRVNNARLNAPVCSCAEAMINFREFIVITTYTLLRACSLTSKMTTKERCEMTTWTEDHSYLTVVPLSTNVPLI